jgi:hypothetical protein
MRRSWIEIVLVRDVARASRQGARRTPLIAPMKALPVSEPERIHRTKLKHKQIALCVHKRLTLRIRQKIAWAILNRTEETLACARQTLGRQILRCGKLPRYRAWADILSTPPEAIVRELFRRDARAQKRNSCHPFGNALSIYETHRCS